MYAWHIKKKYCDVGKDISIEVLLSESYIVIV